MKKNLQTLLPALAFLALALPSCTREAVPSAESVQAPSSAALVSADSPVTFGVAGVTKAFTETTAATLASEGFNVFGVAVSGTSAAPTFANYIENLHVTLQPDGRYFDASNIYYYPQNATMDVYCSNYGTGISVSGGIASLPYTVDAAREYDLVAASRFGVAPSSEAIALSFGHILSQAVVKCEGVDANAVCHVTSIKAKSAATEGSYVFSRSNASLDAWTSLGEAEDVTLFTLPAGQAVANATYAPGSQTPTHNFTALTEAKVFFPGTVTFEVEWFCSSNGQVIGTYSGSADIALEKGKLNNVNLMLPNTSASEVAFTVSVAEWQTAEKYATVE